MSFGLLESGNNLKQGSLNGLSDVARLESARDQTNSSLRSAKKQGEMSSIGTGAAMGFMVGGPVGAAVGGLAGYLLS